MCVGSQMDACVVLKKQKKLGGTMTFCHRYNRSVEESDVCCKASKNESIAIGFDDNTVMCTVINVY
jgi:hypothetical protein